MKKLRYIKPTIEEVILSDDILEHPLLKPSQEILRTGKVNVIYGADNTKTWDGPNTLSEGVKVDGDTLNGSKVNPWGSWDD